MVLGKVCFEILILAVSCQLAPNQTAHWYNYLNLDSLKRIIKRMKIRPTIDQIKSGGRIVYNDGRSGHSGVLATVLAVDNKDMTVQFDDRADTSQISFSDKAWMNFIELAD